MAHAGKIVQKLKEVNKKDQATLSINVNGLPVELQKLLLEALTSIERATPEKTKTEAKLKSADKAEDEARFLGRLRANLTKIEAEQVTVKSTFTGCRDLLLAAIPEKMSDEDLARLFGKLVGFIADLDLLKCMARFKQGELVLHILDQGRTTEDAAKLLQISRSFCERLALFARFATRFPLLLQSGYAMETLLKHKKCIEREAAADENFAAKLELRVTITFEEDELLQEMDEMQC